MIAKKLCIFVGALYNLKEFETKTGKPYIKMNLRTWERQGDNDKVDFFPITAYAGAAEVLKKYFKEGKLVYLQCKPTTYKNKEGHTQYDFVVEEFSFLGDNNAA